MRKKDSPVAYSSSSVESPAREVADVTFQGNKYDICDVFRSISRASGMRKILNLCMSLATKPIGSTHKSGCFILAAAPTVVYPEAEFVCDFGGLLGSTSNVEHCPPVTSHRTLLHSKLQFRLRWRSLSSPNLLLRFGKYVVWAHVAAGILECGTVIWIKKDRGSRRIVDHEGSQSVRFDVFLHSFMHAHTD